VVRRGAEGAEFDHHGGCGRGGVFGLGLGGKNGKLAIIEERDEKWAQDVLQKIIHAEIYDRRINASRVRNMAERQWFGLGEERMRPAFVSGFLFLFPAQPTERQL
jgi:hypothetical protein